VKILLNIVFFLTASCVSINIELEPYSEKTTTFTYYSHYGFFGLIGSDNLNIHQMCGNYSVTHIKNYFSFEDLLFAISTAFLYTPKSTKVWCEYPDKDSISL